MTTNTQTLAEVKNHLTSDLFIHVPRQPETGHGEWVNQRRFGGHCAAEHEERQFSGTGFRLTVYRNAELDTGELMVNHAVRCAEVATSTVELTADEMQSLACALLDAAHDLRTRPAAINSAEASHESQEV